MPRDGSGIWSQPFPDVVEGTTIESTVYNGFTHDVEIDLNTPRPIIAGGTGADDADEALVNLGGEKAAQVVTNYDSHIWYPGSFRSAAGATGAPTANAFSGICYIGEALADPPTNANVVVEARDMSTGLLYIRVKAAGTWGSWAEQASHVATLDARFVNLTGDTMTGNLTIANTVPAIVLTDTDGGGATLSANSTVVTLSNPNNSAAIAIGGTSDPNIYLRNNTATEFQTVAGVIYGKANTAGFHSYAATYPSYKLYVGSTLMGQLTANGAQEVQLNNIYSSGTLTILFNAGLTYNNAYTGKPGGGVWQDTSDARIKTVTGDYESGLAEVLALQPKRYTYKGNDTTAEPSNEVFAGDTRADKSGPAVPYKNSTHYSVAVSGREFIGLIAQEAELAMPEMVAQAEGYIDGAAVSDLRHIDTTPLVYALVNAVKTLAARIEALEAAASP